MQGIPAKDVEDIVGVLREQVRRGQPLRVSVRQCRRLVDGYRRAGEWAVCELFSSFFWGGVWFFGMLSGENDLE